MSLGSPMPIPRRVSIMLISVLLGYNFKIKDYNPNTYLSHINQDILLTVLFIFLSNVST